MDGLRALSVEHLTRLVAHGVEIAARRHVLDRAVDRREPDGRPTGPQRLVQVLGRDEFAGPLQHLDDRGPLRGVAALNGDHRLPSRPIRIGDLNPQI